MDNYFITGFDPQDVIFASLTTAKRGGGEIQALSRRVYFSSSAAGLSYVPKLVAKTKSALRPLPRSFEVPSLGDLAVGMPEDLLRCPVRAFSEYLDRTSGLVNTFTTARRELESNGHPTQTTARRELASSVHFFFLNSA